MCTNNSQVSDDGATLEVRDNINEYIYVQQCRCLQIYSIVLIDVDGIAPFHCTKDESDETISPFHLL
jgi:hypothetical protein